MRLFITYRDWDDHVQALRLQALATVNGVYAYVPKLSSHDFTEPDEETRQELLTCDVIISVTPMHEPPEHRWAQDARRDHPERTLCSREWVELRAISLIASGLAGLSIAQELPTQSLSIPAGSAQCLRYVMPERVQ